MVITKKWLVFLLLNIVVGTNSYSDMVLLESPSVVHQKGGVIKAQTDKESNMKSENQVKKARRQGKGRRVFKRILKGAVIGGAAFLGTVAFAVIGVTVWALAVGL